jgi:hypothetical protein
MPSNGKPLEEEGYVPINIALPMLFSQWKKLGMKLTLTQTQACNSKIKNSLKFVSPRGIFCIYHFLL